MTDGKITNLDWSSDSKYIQINTDDWHISFFQLPKGNEIAEPPAGRVKWASLSCILSKEINGIWPAYAEKTDIDAVSTSHSDQLLATGDDFGMVKLFKYPCPESETPFKQFGGHSAQVSGVKFSGDDSYLISVAEGDQAVIQWRVIHNSTEETNSQKLKKMLTATWKEKKKLAIIERKNQNYKKG